MESRLAEIKAALESMEGIPVTVPIVPVTMTEAWLLFDERAIRRAADNPAGENSLQLPRT